MKTSMFTKILGVILLYLSLILLPIFCISIVDWRNDANRIQVASREFIDKVIDAGQITDDMEEDLNLYLASANGEYVYSIVIETKTINPVYNELGTEVVGYETAWLPSANPDKSNLTKGTIVTLKVEQTDFSLFQRLAMGLLGVSYNKLDCITPGMVR